MNHENLAIKYSCSTCMFCAPTEPESAEGTCHESPPVGGDFVEVDSTTGWCARHQLASAGS